ncbi:MAG: MFS transporter [Alphaproteobacteria bacterium]|nr:MFS transporter [Alphaproteobacteria bacterium]
MTSRSAGVSLAFSQVGHGFSHLLTLLFPTVVLALEREWGLTYDQLLPLALAASILFGLGALPAGWLGDRWSASGMMVIFFLGTGVATVLTGFARTPVELALGMAATGLFASIYHPVGIAWLVRNAKNRGKALGLNGVVGSIGVAAAPLVAGVLTDTISWRAAFVIPGVACTLLGLSMLALMRRGSMMDTRADVTPDPKASRDDVIRAFIVLSLTMIASGLVYQCLSLAMPKVFAERAAPILGSGATGVGIAVSMIYLVSGACTYLGGYLADRYPNKLVYLATFALQVPVCLVAAGAAGTPVIALAATLAILQTLNLPSESMLLARYTPERWRATAFGAKFVLSIGVSAAGVPLIAWIYGATGGFEWLFFAMGAMAAIAAICCVSLPGGRDDVAVPVAEKAAAAAD